MGAVTKRWARWKSHQQSRLLFVHIPVPGMTITSRGLTATRRYHRALVIDPKRGGLFS